MGFSKPAVSVRLEDRSHAIKGSATLLLSLFLGVLHVVSNGLGSLFDPAHLLPGFALDLKTLVAGDLALDLLGFASHPVLHSNLLGFTSAFRIGPQPDTSERPLERIRISAKTLVTRALSRLPPPSEADLLAHRGDEVSLRAALELEPGHDDAAVQLARILHSRGQDQEALDVLGNVRRSFAADGLASSPKATDAASASFPAVGRSRATRLPSSDLLQVNHEGPGDLVVPALLLRVECDPDHT